MQDEGALGYFCFVYWKSKIYILHKYLLEENLYVKCTVCETVHYHRVGLNAEGGKIKPRSID